MRLVAVLGYSAGAGELHEICEERVRHAEQIVRRGDAVLLSGEAGEMHGAWNGSEVFLDPEARNTRGNARGTARLARELGVKEVVVVTSAWHAPRAKALVRAALPSVPVSSSSPRGRPPARLLVRELACLAILPFHLAAVAAGARRPR